MYFLPHQYPILDAFTFFGIALFVCHTVGEILFKTGVIPRISSYIVSGVIFGPNVLNLVSKKILLQMSFLTDISIGLVLFMIGYHLNLKWLQKDRGLLLTCLCEFMFTTIPIFLLLKFFGWSVLYALTVAVIIATISPAILLLVTQDLNSEGPITRRALMITSVNNFLALAIFSVLYPYLQQGKYSWPLLLTHSAYRLILSILMGTLLFKLLELLARYIFPKKQREQFILLISILVLAVVVTRYLNLSIFLTLIAIGIATRNLDFKYAILECNLRAYTHLFFIPLFFMTGCYLDFSGFFTAPIIITACLLIRVVAKMVAVFLFKNESVITTPQAFYLGGALVPLSGFAIGISSKISDFNPAISAQLIAIISACIGFFGIVGPIVLQYILIKSNEAFDNIKKV